MNTLWVIEALTGKNNSLACGPKWVPLSNALKINAGNTREQARVMLRCQSDEVEKLKRYEIYSKFRIRKYTSNA